MKITQVFNCSQIEFDKAKSRDKISLTCEYCKEQYYKVKKNILNKFATRGTYPMFCSVICQGKDRTEIGCKKVICKECSKEVLKKNSEILKVKYSFCSQSCSASFNNKNKTHGTRRSKYEIQLQNLLTELYPNLEVNYSNKTVIGSELDIYIPSLKLAFEIQGIFHYEPIFGQEKLDQIQNNDKLKKEACVSEGIDLVLIDISKLKRCTVNTVIPYNTQVLNTINTHPGLIHISDYSLKVGIKS